MSLKLDNLVSDAERRNVALMIQDGESMSRVSRFLRDRGRQFRRRDLDRWVRLRVLAPVRECSAR